MKKINYGQTISVLANLGVIAGILFLAIEIRQNTRTAQASAYESLTSWIIEFNEGNVERPGLTTSGRVTREAFLELPEAEQTQLRARARARIRYGDLAFYEHELGILSDERFESLIRYVTDQTCAWVFQDIWSRLKSNFVAGYVEYIDAAVAEC